MMVMHLKGNRYEITRLKNCVLVSLFKVQLAEQLFQNYKIRGEYQRLMKQLITE